MKLWGWFIVTTFVLTPITIAQAIGLSLVVGLLTSELKMEEETDNWFDKIITKFVFIVLMYAMILFEGWVIHSFM